MYKINGKIMGSKGSQDSSVGIVTTLWAGRPEFDSLQEKDFLFSVASRKTPAPTQGPTQ
jgi:hypothetical protein